MAIKYLRWCPNGCGKKVVYIINGCKKKDSIYECLICNHKFIKKELYELNTFKGK